MQGQDGRTGPQAYYLRERTFAVPFDGGTSDTRSLVLYASENNGPWRESDETAPDREFQFSAPRDGTYDFAVQEVLRDGSRVPPRLDGLRSNLRVIVDTREPQITIKAVAGRSGTAGVQWDITDANLDPGSILLQGRWSVQQQWQTLSTPNVLLSRDEFFWHLQPGQPYQVRVLARDLAKNEATSQSVLVSVDGGGGVLPEPDAMGSSRRPFDAGPPDVGGGFTDPLRDVKFVSTQDVQLPTTLEVGPSGLSEIQLWVKKDRGGWERVSDPQAGTGPVAGTGAAQTVNRELSYRASEDGLYGFVVVARSAVGLGPEAPAPADRPQVQVHVDTLKPVVRIKDVVVEPYGESSNILKVSWDATDTHLKPKGIDLMYAIAEKPETADWQPFQVELDNTGQFTWVVPKDHPYKFWLRVQAMDLASNLGHADWPQPVIVDTFIPRTNIIDVRPGDR